MARVQEHASAMAGLESADHKPVLQFSAWSFLLANQVLCRQLVKDQRPRLKSMSLLADIRG
jgi:hypothetical protein